MIDKNIMIQNHHIDSHEVDGSILDTMQHQPSVHPSSTKALRDKHCV